MEMKDKLFKLGGDVKQTAEKLGMTQVQVSRREKKVLLFLRQKME